MSNVVDLALHRAASSGGRLSERATLLAVVARNGMAFVGGADPIGKIEALRLERAGLVRIEEYRRDGTSRVMLPAEFEPKSREETSIWIVFNRNNRQGLSA